MQWLRSHPYATTLAGAGILVVIGIFVVESRSGIAPTTGVVTWSGGNTIAPSSATPAPTPSNTQTNTISPPSSPDTNTALLPYTLPDSSDTSDGSSQTSSGTSFDFNAFAAELSNSSGKSSASPGTGSANTGTNSIASAYAFIPSALISTTTGSMQKYNATQQALYEYGNEAGAFIQSYEEHDADQAQVLKDSASDRTNAAQAAAVAQIGSDIEAVGQQLTTIPDLPPQAVSDNAALASSYEAAGASLIVVSQATPGRDGDFVSAMQAYDTTADSFTKNYVAVALLFSANGVTFAPDDPGSVFSFDPSGF